MMHSVKNLLAINASIFQNTAESIPDLSPQPIRYLHQDKIIWKLGDVEHYREIDEPFPNFLLYLLKGVLGKQWADTQYSLSENEQHVILRWLNLLSAQFNEAIANDKSSNPLIRLMPSGNALELMSLADDIYRLLLANALHPKMINRIKNYEEFQGARYECMIAASFIKAGFAIQWQTGTKKQCEFIAKHRRTNEIIAVEVKSRRRRGTLNWRGDRECPNTLRTDVEHLYEKALTQCPDNIPCGIFIDVNLPPLSRDNYSLVGWFDEIKEFLTKYPEHTGHNPAKESFLIFTRRSWHYSESERGKGKNQVSTLPLFVHESIKNSNTVPYLLKAIDPIFEVPKYL